MWFKSNVTIPAVAAISFCLIGGPTPAYADPGDQLFKLLPDDRTGGDPLGRSAPAARPPPRVWPFAPFVVACVPAPPWFPLRV